jgi:hypothetical protein
MKFLRWAYDYEDRLPWSTLPHRLLFPPTLERGCTKRVPALGRCECGVGRAGPAEKINIYVCMRILLCMLASISLDSSHAYVYETSRDLLKGTMSIDQAKHFYWFLPVQIPCRPSANGRSQRPRTVVIGAHTCNGKDTRVPALGRCGCECGVGRAGPAEKINIYICMRILLCMSASLSLDSSKC